jgi:GrpB-like predicted nucleotidyltransferase (UPF0157 family)
MKRSTKACAFVLKKSEAGAPQLLVLSFASQPHLPRRVPGGSVVDGETPIAGAVREIIEETGLDALVVTRKLGVQQYYKAYTRANVERHDYLLHTQTDVPSSFSYAVKGTGGDAGVVFDYAWIGPSEFGCVDPEFQHQLTPEYLPELFHDPGQVHEALRQPDVGTTLVAISAYDPAWPRLFREHCTVLAEVLVGAHIEHIGSTAVPGLGAKPIIDILAAVSTLDEVEARAPQLRWLGYDYVPEYEDRLPERRYFRKVSRRTDALGCHLHCVVRSSDLLRRYIAFRDHLRAHPDTAAAYIALKQSLASRHGADRSAYTEAKGSFIERVLEKANGGTSPA